MNIFIGSDERSDEADQVLVQSIRKNCTAPIEIQIIKAGDPGFDDWVMQPDIPYQYKDNEKKKSWMTRFSCFRFAIPELMGFKGKAIYLDCDMLVLGDLKELYDSIHDDVPWTCAVGYDTDVSVINCDKFNWNWWISIDWMKQSNWDISDYVRYMGVKGKIMMGSRPEWNSHDDSYDGVKLIHFTDMTTQPWKPWPERFSYSDDHPCANAVFAWQHYKNSL